MTSELENRAEAAGRVRWLEEGMMNVRELFKLYDAEIAALKAERGSIRARTIEECANIALGQRNGVTIADMIRNLPLTLACSAAMQLGYLIGAVVTG